MANAALEAGSGLAGQSRVAVHVVPPDRPIRLGVDNELAERVLQPILENACRYGRTLVNVTIARENADVVYRITDDGPGVAKHEQVSTISSSFRPAPPHPAR